MKKFLHKKRVMAVILLAVVFAADPVYMKAASFQNGNDGVSEGRDSDALSTYRYLNPDLTAFLAGFYTKLLDREFDVQGLEYWCRIYFTREMTLEEIVENGFLHSEEFEKKCFDNETFVVKMYESFFDREPDEAGLSDWVRKLESGEETRDSVIKGFVRSEEFSKRLFYIEKPAVDLIIFMGQSNMSGGGGNAAEAPALTKGAGYEFRAITNAGDLFAIKEPFGENENKEGGCDDRFILKRSGTLVTSFVNAYYESTDTPVIAVSASRGSTHMREWIGGGIQLKEDAAQRLTCARDYLEQNGFGIRHIYMVWFQGESDGADQTSADAYKKDFESLFSYMQSYGVEKCFLIETGYDMRDLEEENRGRIESYQAIMQAQVEICRESEDVILASTTASGLQSRDDKWYDGVHFNQESLNRIGQEAGRRAGEYTENGR